jgi:hypothetical protein
MLAKFHHIPDEAPPPLARSPFLQNRSVAIFKGDAIDLCRRDADGRLIDVRSPAPDGSTIRKRRKPAFYHKPIPVRRRG